jgi:hypothetical protein
MGVASRIYAQVWKTFDEDLRSFPAGSCLLLIGAQLTFAAH